MIKKEIQNCFWMCTTCLFFSGSIIPKKAQLAPGIWTATAEQHPAHDHWFSSLSRADFIILLRLGFRTEEEELTIAWRSSRVFAKEEKRIWSAPAVDHYKGNVKRFISFGLIRWTRTQYVIYQWSEIFHKDGTNRIEDLWRKKTYILKFNRLLMVFGNKRCCE